jgi:hypothetical protein
MSFSSEKKPKKRKQKQRKQNALVMPTSTPEPAQNDKSPVLPLEAEPELPEPEPELPPEMLELSELPEFRRLAELLRRLGLAQHLPLCIEHEFDMDTLLACGAARGGGRAVMRC